MRTFKKNKMVEMILERARYHAQLATVDLDFADMASEEISVAVRFAIPKKGYTVKDVIDEVYEYTELLNQNSVVANYICAVSDFKWQYKHTDSIK